MTDAVTICARLSAWAEVAEIDNPQVGKGRLAIDKSDLLGRLIYGGEMPSKTPCPVHQGKWSGCHFAWPGAKWRPNTLMPNPPPIEVDPVLQKWWDAGCRCATHRGSGCTTGWQPDEACGCVEKAA